MLIAATGKGVYFMSKKLERGMIGRTVVFSHCKGKRVESGELVDFECDLLGDYSNVQKATNTLRRRTHDNSIVITSVDIDSDYYSIPIKLFVQTALDYKNGPSELNLAYGKCANDI